jgi:hypothetical protein
VLGCTLHLHNYVPFAKRSLSGVGKLHIIATAFLTPAKKYSPASLTPMIILDAMGSNDHKLITGVNNADEKLTTLQVSTVLSKKDASPLFPTTPARYQPLLLSVNLLLIRSSHSCSHQASPALCQATADQIKPLLLTSSLSCSLSSYC